NNNEIDLESFFEAVYHDSMDIKSLNKSIEAITIEKSQLFDDFDSTGKNSLNDGKKKHGLNHCSYCKAAGHNITIYSKKINDQQ
ncbi:12233_t:CDS:2, partial [Racocetra persica]